MRVWSGHIPLPGSGVAGGRISCVRVRSGRGERERGGGRAGAGRPGLLRDERASVSAEMLLWLPLFIELMLVSFDVFWAYWLHAEMWNVAFGAVREVAAGNFELKALTTPMQTLVQDWVGRQLGDGYAVTYLETSGHHTVIIDADVDRMSAFGNLTDVLEPLSVSVSMAKEPL